MSCVIFFYNLDPLDGCKISLNLGVIVYHNDKLLIILLNQDDLVSASIWIDFEIVKLGIHQNLNMKSCYIWQPSSNYQLKNVFVKP